MTVTDGAFGLWLSQARIAEQRLTAEQRGRLPAAFAFRQRCGADYCSSRVLSHCLRHCHSRLKVAQRARWVGFSRPTAAHQQGVSSQEAIQAAHHRLAGRAARQTAAALCRPHRRVHPDPSRGHPLRHARLHRAHLGRARLHGRFAPLHQEVRPRSRDAGCGHGRPAQRGRRAPSRRTAPPKPAGAAAPFFSTPTQYAGAFLLMPTAWDWLRTAEERFADDYGSLRSGLLTSVFSLGVGLERIFHLDEMADAGFARLCGGRRCPSRHTVGGWRRHLAWSEVDAFCRRTQPWHLLRREDALVSFDAPVSPPVAACL